MRTITFRNAGLLFKTVAVIFFMACACVESRADDGGSWISLQANKSWQKSYGFLRLEHRSFNSFSDTEAKFLATGLGLKLTPWLKADLSYEYWDINNSVTMHKAVLSGTGTLSRGGLSVSVREKLEFAVNPATSSTSFVLRSRLRAQYSLPDSAFRPYIMSENFAWSSWIRSLYYVGTDIVLSQHSTFDLFYLYHVPAGAQQVHLVGIGYNFNF